MWRIPYTAAWFNLSCLLVARASMTPSGPACLQQGANLREGLGGTCNEHLLLARPDSPLWQLHASMVVLARHNAYSG